MKNPGYILVILLLSFSSCKKDRLIGDKKILIGKWEWQHTKILEHCDGYWKYYALNSDSLNKTYLVELLKKGYVRFYENNELVSEHSITFTGINVAEEGLVESNKKFSFKFFMDGDKANAIQGMGTQKDIRFNYYPLSFQDDCYSVVDNRFKKIE